MVIGKGATPIMFPGKQTDTQCERGVGVESHALGEGDAAIGGEQHAPNRIPAGLTADATASKIAEPGLGYPHTVPKRAASRLSWIDLNVLANQARSATHKNARHGTEAGIFDKC